MPNKNVFCDLGPVSAYALAKAHGYTGTEEQWAQQQAQAGNYAREAKEARTGAETAKTQTEALVKNAEQSVNRAKGEADRADAAANRAECRIENTTVAADKAWASKETVDRLCTPFVKKAPIVQGAFVPGYPMGLKSYIEPVQEGEGEPSPQNVRPIHGVTQLKTVKCGQNLAEEVTKTARDIISTPVFLKKGVIYRAITNYDIASEGGSASVSFRGSDTNSVLVIERTKQYVEYTPQNDMMAVVRVYSMGNKLTDKNNIRILLETALTSYESYSGETFTQQLPEEVFGGVYEWDTGKLTVTAERIAATSKLNPGYGKHTNGMPYLSIGKGSALVANGLIASDRYRAGAWSDQNGRAYIPDSDSIIFTDNRFTDADTAYRIIDEERPEFICKLKTAREIQLQKHLVVAQKGITTVYGNAAQTEVTARRDPGAERRELEKRIAALEAAHTPTL